MLVTEVTVETALVLVANTGREVHAIRVGGALSLTDRDVSGAERPVNRDELIRLIRSKQSKKPDQPVVISADKDVKYEAVIQIMDLLQQNQVKRVGLLAKPRSG